MSAVRRIPVRNWDDRPEEGRDTVRTLRGGKPVTEGSTGEIMLEETVMYWRKANHIHWWFVVNVQGDQDDCGTYNVSWEQLEDLLRVCKQVMKASKLIKGKIVVSTVYDKNHPMGRAVRKPGKVIEDATVAKRLLPRQEGFFFGSQEYDESYLDDVRETRDWIALMLRDRSDGLPGRIRYSSSW